MEYIAFALKYRPRNFDEVVGQTHVVASLRNAIITKHVHHAYLFSGPRGVGKTSLARILAKSLNCEKGPTPKPCDSCASCISISKGNCLDIIEIDGASNRGIDEIRALRESVKLSSAGSRFKIYIIDEVHMLTQEAFNALLKTLEEPPPHVKFIFATTNPHKVLPTILSRCQKFQFNLLSLEEIAGKLKKIIMAEKINIQESLLYTIARLAAGSIRDAESLLDQLVPLVLEKGALDDVFSFLGIIDEESLNATVDCLVRKDITAALSLVDKVAKAGKDLGIFLSALIEHLRNLLLAKVSPNTFKDLCDISSASKQYLLSLSSGLSAGDILKVIDLLLGAKEMSSRLNTVRIPLELALIKYSYRPDVSTNSQQPPRTIVQEQKSREKTTVVQPVKPEAVKLLNPKTIPQANSEDFDINEEDFDIYSTKAQHKESPKPKTDPAATAELQSALLEDDSEEQKEEAELRERDDILLAPLRAKWKEIIHHIQKTRAALGSHLSFGSPLFSRGSVVTMAFPPNAVFHKEIVENAKNQRFIESVISKFMNKTISVRFILQELEPDASKKASDLEDRASHSAQETAEDSEEFLNELMDTFGGKFHSDDQQS